MSRIFKSEKNIQFFPTDNIKVLKSDSYVLGRILANIKNIGRMIQQLTDAIRGSVERSIICLLHLDVLTTTNSSLSPEAKETIPLLYENPDARPLVYTLFYRS